MTRLDTKERTLRAHLRRYGSVLIAFSGGVDSSVLLAEAAKVLPRDRVLAVTARSATYPVHELKLARAIARRLKAQHRVVDSCEFEDSRFVANPPRRCYYCKSELFGRLVGIARAEGFAYVLDGNNLDDKNDFRPGRQAAAERGVVSPLMEAGLTKAELRLLAKRFRLPNWDKPAAACLASRVPYGTRLDEKLLGRIDAAELLLLKLGFTQVRVRHHETIARLEIEPAEFPRMIRPDVRRRIVRELLKLGYQYVALDLAGYRTGSMNRMTERKK